ncbi:MAG: bifunctional oligoribonuclease/PAP phosphatase NrnA [Candidatus Omnitrophica bacterium]|nr:bifunctional oligoribonuclease/PAP phosphatase NrnA [Candidatus Omnitrophota bacterium]
MSIEKTIEAIRKFNKYIIVSHIGPEGDSIGSQFAFKILLEKLGKKAVVVNDAKPPSQYDFLDVNDDIITNVNKKIDYEAIAVLDCPVIKRIGKVERYIKKDKAIINVDHHISNSEFGSVNWVEPYMSSCGEMVYNLYKALKVPINYRSAFFLYLAIVMDTGSFAYENTSPDTHAIASELIKKGLRPDHIFQAIYESKTLSEVNLLKEALSTIKTAEGGKLAYMHVSKSMLKSLKLPEETTEGLINYARSIRGTKAAIIFLEKPSGRGNIDISFRSKGEVDVDKIASLFGGGGHKNASGCVVKGKLKDVMKHVLKTVARNL